MALQSLQSLQRQRFRFRCFCKWYQWYTITRQKPRLILKKSHSNQQIGWGTWLVIYQWFLSYNLIRQKKCHHRRLSGEAVAGFSHPVGGRSPGLVIDGKSISSLFKQVWLSALLSLSFVLLSSRPEPCAKRVSSPKLLRNFNTYYKK